MTLSENGPKHSKSTPSHHPTYNYNHEHHTMVKHEILLAILGHEGDLIASSPSSDDVRYKCTALAKSMLATSEVNAIERIVRVGHCVSAFHDYLMNYHDNFDYNYDISYAVGTNVSHYESTLRVMLHDFVSSLECKVADLERACEEDPALGLGFLATEMEGEFEWIWILYDGLYDVLWSCNGSSSSIDKKCGSEENDVRILNATMELKTSPLDETKNLEKLQRAMYEKFCDRVTLYMKYASVPLPVKPDFVNNVTLSQLVFIGKCIHEYRAIYIPIDFSSTDSSLDLFHYKIDAVYRHYNDKLFLICKTNFEHDINSLNNMLLLQTLKNIDEYVPSSPIICDRHIDKYKEIKGYLEATRIAIVDVNKYFQKLVSPYRANITLTLTHIHLWQKMQVLAGNKIKSSKSFTALVSNLDQQLFDTCASLNVLSKILAEFYSRIPNRVREEDYRKLYRSLLESESELGSRNGIRISDLAYCLDWNEWLTP